jgi:cell division protease FtsH
MDNKQHFLIWCFVDVTLAMLAVQSFFSMPHAQPLAYSEFQVFLQTGKVKEVVIADDQLSGVADLSGSKEPVSGRSGNFSRPGWGPRRFT